MQTVTSINDLKSGPLPSNREAINRYLAQEGYEVNSMRLIGQDHVIIRAVRATAESREDYDILLSISQVTSDMVADILEGGESDNKMVLALSGITEKAKTLISMKNIATFTAQEIDEEDSHKILERVYADGLDMEKARKHFTAKSRAFGIFSSKEIDEIIRGYAPVASFRLVHEPLKDGAGQTKVPLREWENTFNINLNSLELYYMKKQSLRADPEIHASDFLQKVSELPHTTLTMVSALIELGELSRKTLDEPDYVSLRQSLDLLQRIINMGLARLSRDGTGFISHISIPDPASPKYRIGEHLEKKEMVETSSRVDPVNWSPQQAAMLLSAVFMSDVDFMETAYLPYYQCKYYNGEGRVEYARILTPKPNG